MNFDISDDQRMLKDSIERLLADRYEFETRNRYRKETGGYSEEMWGRFAELGLLALPFAEEDGGFGGGAVEMMIVMEAFGAALIVEPYFATVVLAGGALRHAAGAGQRAELVGAIAEGTLKLALAHSEPQARYNLADVETRARRDGDTYVLSGRKGLVLHGDAAGKLIVSARTSGDRRDRQGISLFLVDAGTPGISIRGYPTQDGLRAAEITLEDVSVPASAMLGAEGQALPAVERTIDEANAALCAEAVGAFEVMHRLTLDYIKTRSQFGTAIGAFQVLQHAAVEMFIELEQSRSMAMYATMMSRDNDAGERARAVSAAKTQIGRSVRLLGQNAIQLHGGVGMTMEYAVGHYFKRVTMIDKLFGDADFHLNRLAALGGLMNVDDLEAREGKAA